MRKFFFVCVFWLPLIAISQIKRNVSIDWIEKREMSFGSFTLKIPQFSGDGFYYDPSKKAVFLSLKLKEAGSFDEKAIQISDVVYETISESQLGDLATENISKSISAIIQSTYSRGEKQSFLMLSPIIKDDFGYKKVVSFSYALQQNSTFKAAKSNFKQASITNSVLGIGDWYRFYVEKSGVYKISKSFLKQMGFDVAHLDPKKIKIYGNGGRMLPLSNAQLYPSDLAENAIQVFGENDGTFDNEDYILFYAEGVDVWNEESQTNSNLYDSKSYYYITAQGTNGKRITNMFLPVGNSDLTLNSFDDHQYHEADKINIAHLGRQWFGEVFDINQEQEFGFDFPNIDSTAPIKLTAKIAAAAYTPTSFRISVNGSDLGAVSFPSLSTNSDIEFNVANFSKNNVPANSDKVNVKLTYNNNGVPGSKGYLDYLLLTAKRKLQGNGKQFHFQYDLSNSSLGIVTYNISNASGISQIWDVTDLYNVTKFENSNQNSVSFKANLGELRKYVAIDPADYYIPLMENKSKIENQNLKGTVFENTQGQFQDIDYVIITPLFLKNQAEKLANFHRTYSNLNVKVIPLESIYQEFSSGKQDIAAIRNCVKYIYENASVPEKRVKYVNLFGDASYDYKNRIANNTNIVPIYHALNSNSSGESSFASDDFYGLMDAGEGNITSFFGGIDIAVGRMLVADVNQAEAMVNKIIEYHGQKSYGNWRNNLVLISDDSDKTSDATLQNRQNSLADVITAQKPFFNVNKIILDSYTQEASAGGERYPKAKEDFYAAFEKGALVINYLGHGGEDGLASERIWDKADSQSLSNSHKYPLFITITCEFSRFDNPSKSTAGEYAYWNPRGGAISMLTTIRSIGQFSAENFNDILTKNLLSFGSNQYPSIAEALRISKNSNPNSASNVVLCIGDPALMLAIPKLNVRLTKVNDVPVSQPFDDFKSLAKMKLTGEITDENNNKLTNYNGTLSTVVFDKTTSKTTLDNDGNSSPMNFNVLGEAVFRGNASVVNGQFEFSLVVPKDIRIPLGNGRVSFYSQKQQPLENFAGYDLSIKVGGINKNAATDNIGPKLKLYMNEETFVSGGITNKSPFLLAFLEDENGINTASGIGHDIVAVLDGDVNKTYILNDYYQTNLDDFTNGTVRFPLRDLTTGLHSISFKAWDVYNNPVTAEIQFVVMGNEGVTLTHVLNYPNPFVNYTEFWFSHNRPYEPLEVQVQVMTITGKVVWTKNQTITTDGFLSKEITWDGKDDFGNKIGKGVYVYKLTVQSNLTNSKVEKYEKLVIL